MKFMLLKNAIIELEITDTDYEGFGIAHYEGYTIFVSNALETEVVRALILKVGKNIAFAKTLDIIKYSKERMIPPCPYYAKCGGCDMMHMSYQEELRVKGKCFKKTLEKMLGKVKVNPVVGAKSPFYYRNKIQLPVGYIDDKFVVGFYQPRSHNIIPSDNCMIENKETRKIINHILELLNNDTIYPYDEATNTGDIRHLILRVNEKNEFMVILVFREMRAKVMKFVNKINNSKIKSIYININPKATNVILGEEFIHVYGDKYLKETLFDNTYLIHPNSFFQVNFNQMKVLYETAIKLLNPTKDDVIIDAYSGIGTITLTMAKYAKKVYGIEVVSEAVLNANQNKANNKIENVEFILGKCEEEIKALVNKEKIDAIMMDPPRKGSDQKFLDTIIEAKIPKIVYISCGPAALARDLKYLTEHNYEIKKIVPVDMFSKTANLESITLLGRIEQ